MFHCFSAVLAFQFSALLFATSNSRESVEEQRRQFFPLKRFIKSNFFSLSLHSLGPRPVESNSFDGAALARSREFTELPARYGYGGRRHVITCCSRRCSLLATPLPLSGISEDSWAVKINANTFPFSLKSPGQWRNVPTQPIQPSPPPSALTSRGLTQRFVGWNCIAASIIASLQLQLGLSRCQQHALDQLDVGDWCWELHVQDGTRHDVLLGKCNDAKFRLPTALNTFSLISFNRQTRRS
jgi:hypothetical protein